MRLILDILWYIIPEPDDTTDGGDGDSSSNGGGGDPDDLTNPDFEPEDDDSNCFVSNEEGFPWYSVDMGRTNTIDRVMLTAGTNDGKFTELVDEMRWLIFN